MFVGVSGFLIFCRPRCLAPAAHFLIDCVGVFNGRVSVASVFFTCVCVFVCVRERETVCDYVLLPFLTL